MSDLKRRPRAKRHRPRVPSKGKLRAFKLGEGLPPVTKLSEELFDMTDVLMGRKEPPLPGDTWLTLQEVADAYFARACEIEMLIHQATREGRTTGGSGHNKFRTGELRSFKEMAKRAAELGSRRLSEQQFLLEKERFGLESKGGD